jgi:16S rRNA (adenine1518-N6/adenine1519-N6)-dimethyltransferase
MFRRKTGQCFLQDTRIAERQVKYADISKEDVVLEVGPGYGILTKPLCRAAKKVIAVEKDPRLVWILEGQNLQNLSIINADVMDLDFSKIKFNKVVSNPPYYIASPLTFKLLSSPFKLGVLMYQLEFAKRLVANPGDSDYGRLTVNTFYWAECSLLEKVSRRAFKPQPAVDSCIVQIKPRSKPPFSLNSLETFFRVVDLIFTMKRKKISTILRDHWKVLFKRKEGALEVIKNFPLREKRPEELFPDEIGELSNLIFAYNL